MKSKTHSSDTRTITNKVLRRTAATVAGLAMIIGGFIAAAPARADVDALKVTATSGPVSHVNVTGCLTNSSGVTYRIEDRQGRVAIPETPLPSWDGATDFFFDTAAPLPGEYTIFVTCLGYSNIAARTGSANFTTTTSLQLSTPFEWRSGDKIVINAKGATPGELVTFGLNDDGRALYRWTAKANTSGIAQLGVVWPGTEPGSSQALKPGPYELFVVTDSANGPYAVTVQLLANSLWVFGKGPVGGGGGLPNTGD